MKSRDQKLSIEEKNLLKEVERGEWVSTGAPSSLDRYRQIARETMKKDKRVNIRISERDLLGIQRIALEEGIPYQTLMSSVLHKFAEGRLVAESSQ